MKSLNEIIAYADDRREELEGVGLSESQVLIIAEIYNLLKGVDHDI